MSEKLKVEESGPGWMHRNRTAYMSTY